MSLISAFISATFVLIFLTRSSISIASLMVNLVSCTSFLQDSRSVSLASILLKIVTSAMSCRITVITNPAFLANRPSLFIVFCIIRSKSNNWFSAVVLVDPIQDTNHCTANQCKSSGFLVFTQDRADRLLYLSELIPGRSYQTAVE